MKKKVLTVLPVSYTHLLGKISFCLLIMSWGLGRNVTLPTISKYAKNGFNDEKTERDLSKRLLDVYKRQSSIHPVSTMVPDLEGFSRMP